ncbi:hypothetical protein [Marivirga arenosa]|uniref:Uncharacterized protein n=1 Tax=Marivirga arenosa TaxID=3059076 RepID=A0AA51ZUQ8_9BACT|nr:hypothetical protein [Marivirga sp. BKB1-2]WNB16903.1 hypothetical protein QYS47_32190 [Marivirga sp. BKB1-2]
MNKFLRKPKAEVKEIADRFGKLNLKENPFPYNPFIEPESEDPKRNGEIFNREIRKNELDKFHKNFLKKPLTGDHDRIGYLLESSFTGRGNGKSAFLVNIDKDINQDFGDSTSNSLNKTFSVYIKAKAGQTSKFWQLSELIITEICKKNIFEDCLITLRYKVLKNGNDFDTSFLDDLNTEADFRNLLDNNFLLNNKVDFSKFNTQLKKYLIDLGVHHELASSLSYMSSEASRTVFETTVNKPDSWKKKELNRILFDELVRIFLAADFNGSYILLDEFEKIVDYQKPSERIEFAYEIRQNLLESNLQGAIHGFFILLLTIHPGTQRLLLEGWEKAGLNARSPLPSDDLMESPHVVAFDDIKKQDIRALMEVYLNYYRIEKNIVDLEVLSPFTEDAIDLIAKISKFNAARILKFAHIALNELTTSDREKIDQTFVSNLIDKKKTMPQENITSDNFLNREKSPMEDALGKSKLNIK